MRPICPVLTLFEFAFSSAGSLSGEIGVRVVDTSGRDMYSGGRGIVPKLAGRQYLAFEFAFALTLQRSWQSLVLW